MNTQTKQKGFSIIEVVLVLAIAGLIFLMVFIALPALQRGQRDTARQNEVNTVVSQMGTYAGANNGRLPTDANDIAKMVTGKADSNKLESDTQLFVKRTTYAATTLPTVDLDAVINGTDAVLGPQEIYIYIGFKCGVDSASGKVTSLERGNTRQAVALSVVESTGGIYCKST